VVAGLDTVFDGEDALLIELLLNIKNLRRISRWDEAGVYLVSKNGFFIQDKRLLIYHIHGFIVVTGLNFCEPIPKLI
jgi:hypothetical protein